MSRLLYLVGPSGSGKDSLLDALRDQQPPGFIVAHRYITRPASAGSENHVALSVEEYQKRRELGLFALHWDAHQTHYALGIEIDLWMQQGLNVIANGSREYLQQAQQRYGERLLPICLHVSPSVLEKRLQQRGRENGEQISARLQRAADYQHMLPANCHLLANDGALQDTLAELLALICPMQPIIEGEMPSCN
ncbi:ribose 1,5-bisphosphokinase [Rouxiella sp. Mn2063]|uniref:ribose 1,5-bisphosphokinase n=1 Tax=Rouxiella sp. Mn2063 TaxID=3395262 RepID=UPI003BE7E93C